MNTRTTPPPDSHVHQTVVRALARRSPLTGIVVLEYGLRYAIAAIAASARWSFFTGTKWALYFVAAGLVSFCAVVGMRRGMDRMDVDGPGWGTEAARLVPGSPAEGA